MMMVKTQSVCVCVWVYCLLETTNTFINQRKRLRRFDDFMHLIIEYIKKASYISHILRMCKNRKYIPI